MDRCGTTNDVITSVWQVPYPANSTAPAATSPVQHTADPARPVHLRHARYAKYARCVKYAAHCISLCHI